MVHEILTVKEVLLLKIVPLLTSKIATSHTGPVLFHTGAICNYSNVATSKLDIVSGLKEGMVKMSQNPYLFLAMLLYNAGSLHHWTFVFDCTVI